MYITPDSRAPPTTPGKQRICIAGYCWSSEFRSTKDLATLLVEELSNKYELWCYDTEYIEPSMSVKRKALGDDLQVFDRLPLCWVQYDDGHTKIIGGKNRFAAWLVRNEKGSKAAMDAVFHEICDHKRTTKDRKEKEEKGEFAAYEACDECDASEHEEEKTPEQHRKNPPTTGEVTKAE